ncbi:phage major capsid protein [Methanobrevibacter smithii]|uniref:Ig-like domain-containing protein n=1 Tax=Methanobrevibacter smithii TaxID=2173 RepID=UPI0037DC8668
MATKPEIKTMNASAMDILNVIRANASSTYQERIPEATQDNIREIGNAMLTYESTQNEFLNALVNRIARVIITSKSYQNPLRMFKKGVLEFGETIEEIFVNIARAHQFDPAVAEKEVFKREIPDVNAVFHKMNYQNFYKTTISNEQLRQAFLSYQGISDLIARIVDSLYTGSEFDEFLVMKQLIVDAANDGKMYAVTIPEVTPDNAKTIVAKIKGVSNSMEFMSTTYNSMGVLNYTKKENQIFLIDAAFDAMIDVEVLASAFNMSKAEFMGQRVLIDNFGELTGVYAAIVDKDWFMVFDNWIGFTENYNGQGLYWNYFYHCWKTFSTSPFSNAVLFTTNATSVTSVTVTPPTAELTKGSSMQFSAAVVTSGYVPKGVTWSVSGASDTVSTITPDGLLTVPTAEQNTTLTVTATSVYDASKKGTSTVTLN